MSSLFASLNLDGLLPIPAEAQEALGLHPGSRLEITVRDGQLIARPVQTDDLKQLRGILSGGSDLVQELQRERRSDKW